MYKTMATVYGFAPPVVDSMTMPQIRALLGESEGPKKSKSGTITHAEVMRLIRESQQKQGVVETHNPALGRR